MKQLIAVRQCLHQSSSWLFDVIRVLNYFFIYCIVTTLLFLGDYTLLFSLSLLYFSKLNYNPLVDIYNLKKFLQFELYPEYYKCITTISDLDRLEDISFFQNNKDSILS